MVLVEFIIDLLLDTKDPLVNDSFPVENLFVILSENPWYNGILTYVYTQSHISL